MNVIPVIDLLAGQVVRAVAGDRANYRPLRTPLAEGSAPLAVARGLLGLHRFTDLYIADLDGIRRRVPDLAVLEGLSDALPGLVLWVDNGAASARDVARLHLHAGVMAVVGSETLRDPAELEAARRAAPDRIALSLDFRGPEFQGPPELLQRPDLWPRRVIVMTLAHVGTEAGPDLARIGAIHRSAPPGSIVMAAGGVRDRADLVAARAAGASGALVASALHAGKLKAGDLEEIAGL